MDTKDENGPESPLGSADSFAAAATEAVTMAAPSAPPVGDADDTDDEVFFKDLFEPSVGVTEDLDNPVMVSQTLKEGQASLAALMTDRASTAKLAEALDFTVMSPEREATLSPEHRRIAETIKSLADFWSPYYDELCNREGGDWRQRVQLADTRLGISKPSAESITDPVLRIRSHLGQGSLIQVPLWHTGIWVTLRPPVLADLSDLDQQLRMDKLQLGRASNGAIYSSAETHLLDTLSNFVLKHVAGTTYEFTSDDQVGELRSVILMPDFPLLLNGLLVAMYPGGYPLRQPCISSPGKCEHVEELAINFARMTWTDHSRLNELQIRHMASRRVKRPLVSLKAYQAEFKDHTRRVPISDNLFAIMRVPSIADQVVSGYRWIESIESTTRNALGKELSENQRYGYSLQRSNLTAIRQYGHWISEFEFTEEPKDSAATTTTIADPDKVDELIDTLSSETNLITQTLTQIEEWISDVTVSYVALPKRPCPACQKEVSPEYIKHPRLIPIDVAYVFFILRVTKIDQVTRRALAPR